MIETGCEITDSIIMGSDYYNKVRMVDGVATDEYPIKIGYHTRIHRTIVDKNATIGSNVVIHPGDRVNEDNEWCHIRDGIVVIPKGKIIPDGTIV